MVAVGRIYLLSVMKMYYDEGVFYQDMHRRQGNQVQLVNHQHHNHNQGGNPYLPPMHQPQDFRPQPLINVPSDQINLGVNYGD